MARGYPKWSAAVADDQNMNDWVRATNLTEILQQSKPTPNEGPHEATLDQVFITHESSPFRRFQFNGVAL